ncbi:LIM homeobox transcription factor 1-beta isoform X2 [Episyrphus balteatus]|uniref:LIM homeobox transcription factor 1-beta isoform X2 n=1 Tax=Episyrphus balteatus TaxID=286459 RepID=UPI002485BD1D|nr:LIM homeobox transcription factor 1-beta isoform X2 [Episyrphus balteatus]
MLEDQHHVAISMFPLDMKCHQQQQQQQQQHPHHCQQPIVSGLGPGPGLSVSSSVSGPTSSSSTLPPPPQSMTTGNDRMLTSAIIQPTINEAMSDVGGVLGNRTTNHNNNATNNNNTSTNSSGSGNSNNVTDNNINGNHKTNSVANQQHHHHHPQHQHPAGPALHHHSSANQSRTILSDCSSSLCSMQNCGPQLQHHSPHHSHYLQHHQSSAATAALHQQQSLSSVLAAAAAAAAVSAAASVTATSTLGSSVSLQCGYCCQQICDRYIMRVVDTSYHEGCLKCTTCSIHLVHSCFIRDGKLYCRIDYERLFIRNRCLGCGHKIGSDELVMRALENVFHLKCFACVVCGVLLKKGEQYVVKQGQLFCRFDYEKEVEMLQGYDFYGDELFPPKLDGRRGPKRPRTILNTQQRRAFKASFEVSPKPCRKVRENLAKDTGLSLRIVQVWFQNQRAKVKKIQKKAKQEQKGASETDSQESDSSLAKIKDETHSDSESLESPFSLGEKARLIKDEIQNENTPFNCTETNKENCNKTNEPILNTILGLSYATFQQLMGPFNQPPMINPIDRLYSMQNSYFRPEDINFNECKDPDEN